MEQVERDTREYIQGIRAKADKFVTGETYRSVKGDHYLVETVYTGDVRESASVHIRYVPCYGKALPTDSKRSGVYPVLLDYHHNEKVKIGNNDTIFAYNKTKKE